MLKYPTVKLLFTIVIVVMLSLNMYGLSFSAYWYVLPVILFLSLVVLGSFLIQWKFFIESKNHGASKGNKISLTFDDGPHEVYTRKVLDILDKYNAKATFFCIGEKLQKSPALANEIINRGHSIGNHSYRHQYNFPMFTTKKIIDEIEKTNAVIEIVAGIKANLFRPPFGVTNPRIARAIKQFQMEVIGWNVRSYDTVDNDTEKVVKRVTKKLKAGGIVLLHDDRENIPNILEEILLYMQQQKLKSVCVEDLLKI